jgi:Ca2+-binding EF-hand superfamily protein
MTVFGHPVVPKRERYKSKLFLFSSSGSNIPKHIFTMIKRSKSENSQTLNRYVQHLADVLIVVALFILTACASNKNLQSSQSGGGFDAADANHDGKLSRNEASDFLVNEIFDSRDANHDGRMTEEEWTAGDPKRAADFKKRDANKDGVVTKEEALAYGRAHGVANKILKEADKDHDGELDRAEVQAYYGSREGRP